MCVVHARNLESQVPPAALGLCDQDLLAHPASHHLVRHPGAQTAAVDAEVVLSRH